MGVGGGGAVAGVFYLATGDVWAGLLLLVLSAPIIFWAWRKLDT